MTCSERIYSGARYDFLGHQCKRKATILVDGNWWCKTHSPDGKAAKAARDDAKYQAQRELSRLDWDTRIAKSTVITRAKEWAQDSTNTQTTADLYAAVLHLRLLEQKREELKNDAS